MSYSHIFVDLSDANNKYVRQIKDMWITDTKCDDIELYIYKQKNITQYHKCFCIVDDIDNVAGFLITIEYHSDVHTNKTNPNIEDDMPNIFVKSFVLISELLIGEHHRRKGLASALFEKVRETYGVDVSMRLTVSITNYPAITLYQKQGFDIFGFAREYYNRTLYVGDGIHAYIMTRVIT